LGKLGFVGVRVQGAVPAAALHHAGEVDVAEAVGAAEVLEG
jgi:hypothetical protein